MLDIYVCGKLVRFLYKSDVHGGEPFSFFNFTEPQTACYPAQAPVLAVCTPTGGLWAEPNLNKNMAIHSPLM